MENGMRNDDAMNIFDLELNVGSIFGAIIATAVYYLNNSENIWDILSITLTFIFPIYLLKVSRTYEYAKKNNLDYAKMLFFPNKHEVKDYIKEVCQYLIFIAIAIVFAFICNFGIHHAVNIFWKVVACYLTFITFIVATFIMMTIIFDFILALILISKRASNGE